MKTKISQIISKSLLFAFIVLLGSCNYLDVDQYFDDTLKFDSVFTQKRYFERICGCSRTIARRE